MKLDKIPSISVCAQISQEAKAYKIPFFFSLLFGSLAFGFSFTNKLVNWDEVYYLFSKGGSAVLGRWGLDVMERLLPNVSMPWIYGLMTLALISVSVCVICHIFQIRSKLLQVLLAGSIVVFPSLISTMSYMFTAASYGVAFLAAVLAVYGMQKHTKSSILAALALMVFSLSIYQAYVAVTASLLVLLLVQSLLQGGDVKKALGRGVEYVLFLGISLILYYLSAQLVLRVTGQSFSGYATGNMDLSLSDIPGKIALAYERFFLYFRRATMDNGLIATPLSKMLHILLLLASALLLLIWILEQKRRNWLRLLFLLSLLLVLPLTINCMFLFTTEDAIHTLVLYSFISIYLLVILLADHIIIVRHFYLSKVHRASREIVAFSLCLIIISNIYTSNEVYLAQYLRFQNAFSFYTGLTAEMQMVPEYNKNTKIALVGDNWGSSFYYINLSSSLELTGTAGFFLNSFSVNRFIEYFIGYPVAFATDEEVTAIMSTPEYAEMACYPYYGSMKLADGVLIVKLS